MAAADRSLETPTACLFREMLGALAHVDKVELGRQFGRWCIKLDRRPFIVLDGETLAFRVGLDAPHLAAQRPGCTLWNPRYQRRAKETWVAEVAADLESLATLGSIAYLRALAESRDAADVL